MIFVLTQIHKIGATDNIKSTSTAILTDEERLNAQIAELAEKIKKAKQENMPKEEWDPTLKEMLALKVTPSRCSRRLVAQI